MGIQALNISKRFGGFVALDDVTVDVHTGQLTALLGPSGGGKSTLLRIIAGLDQADSGTVRIDGADATSLPPQRRNVGFVFQHYAAFKHLSVYRNVAFGLEVRKRPRAEIRRRVHELLELVHLDQFSDRLPSQLSGGQRQRMALARALAAEPNVLLLDEPFGALDAKVRKELRDWLRRLHDEVHVTTVFVTHDQEEALEVADELVVINAGRVEQVGGPNDLYDRPANEFVMEFLGPITRLNGRLLRPHDIDVFETPHDATVPAQVERLQRVGFEVRADLRSGDSGFWVQLTPGQVEALNLREGAPVWVRPSRGAATIDAAQPDRGRSGPRRSAYQRRVAKRRIRAADLDDGNDRDQDRQRLLVQRARHRSARNRGATLNGREHAVRGCSPGRGNQIGNQRFHGGVLDAHGASPDHHTEDCDQWRGTEREHRNGGDEEGQHEKGTALDAVEQASGGQGSESLGRHGRGVDQRDRGNGNHLIRGQVVGDHTEGDQTGGGGAGRGGEKPE